MGKTSNNPKLVIVVMQAFAIVLISGLSWFAWKAGYDANSMGLINGVLISLFGTLIILSIGIPLAFLFRKSVYRMKHIEEEKLIVGCFSKSVLIGLGLMFYYLLLVYSFSSPMYFVALPVIFYAVTWLLI